MYIVIYSSDLNQLNSKLNSVVYCIFKWFQNNQLVLKTHIVKFVSCKVLTYPLHNACNIRAFTISENIIFLGMHLDCLLSWKSHIDNLVKKLSSICLMLRKLLPIVNVNILQMVYFVHFYSQINYGIIFWGSSSSMRIVFIIQKRAIRNMLRVGP